MEAKRKSVGFLWALAIGILFFAAAVSFARRPFWYDELFTLYVTGMPDMNAVWQALRAGADLNPPLFYVATRFATSLAGASEVGLRLPSLIGYSILCLSLWRFTSRRLGPGWGLGAMLTPMVAGPVVYSVEARAYGMVLGFTGLAMVCWQERHRRWGLPLLTVCLTGALLSHCYAVLVLFPFGLAEIWRAWRRGRVDWLASAAICTPLAAVLTYLPLFGAVRGVAVDNPVFAATPGKLVEFYRFLLGPVGWIALALLVLIVLMQWGRKPKVADEVGVFETDELVLALGFLLVPILAYSLAALVTRIFMLRYGLAAVCGLGVLVPALLRRVAGGSAAASILLPITFGITLLISIAGWPAIRTEADLGLRQMLAIEGVHPELPLVVGSGLTYLELDHYAPDSLARRTHFLADAAMARQWTGTDMFDKSFPELHRRFPIRSKLRDALPFLESHPRFLLYAMPHHEMDWLVPYLKSRHWRLNPLPAAGGMRLYLAEAPLSAGL